MNGLSWWSSGEYDTEVFQRSRISPFDLKPTDSMHFLKRQITSPRVDAVLMVLVGWTLIDAGGVAVSIHPILGNAFWMIGVASFVIAWLSWRRRVPAH